MPDMSGINYFLAQFNIQVSDDGWRITFLVIACVVVGAVVRWLNDRRSTGDGR